ncbi:MAG: NADH-quinone oxidoreductase subunit C [Oligoflexia bacterium]|nr:NADH-quinone oxidoreductase subunit C [Oligoflexia bacterium]
MSNESNETNVIELSLLKEKIQELQANKYRMVHIGCSKIGDNFEVIYAFDKDYQMVNLKVLLPIKVENVENVENAVARTDCELPSISSIYWSAFLYENEIAELFGLKINDMKVDYRGNFYRTTEKAAFSKKLVKNKIEVVHK